MPRKYPKKFICTVCGKEYWARRSKGRCSVKCAMKKRTNEYLEKYGRPSHPASNNREKAKQTCLKKYGVENPSQIEEVKKKKADTCIKHYGETTYLLTEESKIKYKKACLEKYGFEDPNKSEIVKNRIKQTFLKKYGFESANSSEIVKQHKKEHVLKNMVLSILLLFQR